MELANTRSQDALSLVFFLAYSAPLLSPPRGHRAKARGHVTLLAGSPCPVPSTALGKQQVRLSLQLTVCRESLNHEGKQDDVEEPRLAPCLGSANSHGRRPASPLGPLPLSPSPSPSPATEHTSRPRHHPREAAPPEWCATPRRRCLISLGPRLISPTSGSATSSPCLPSPPPQTGGFLQQWLF